MSHCYSSQKVSLLLLFFSQQEKKCQMVSVEVRKSQHKYVIGPRGSNIAEILHETGVSVEMPSPDSTTETITLRGPQEKLGQGGFHFFVCVLLSVCVLILCLLLIGCLFLLSVAVCVLSHPHEISSFPTALTLVYAKANSVTTADVEAPAWLHKFIIGRKGANIKQITQDSKVGVFLDIGYLIFSFVNYFSRVTNIFAPK